VLTLFGMVLIFRRHRYTRIYWIAALIPYCVMRLAEVFFSQEPLGAAFLLVTGVVWLAYWWSASAPRQLGLVRFWHTPDRGAA
jgi:hypothetical protein